MIKLLVANGCSYTRGAELQDPASTAWPARLAKRLGVQVANLASDGGSNRRAVRTTVGNLDRVCRDFDVPVPETLVLCMWTGTARGECHLGRRRDRGKRPDLPYETNWHRLGRWRMREGDRASEAYFRHLWTEQGATIDLLTDWILLDSFLRHRGAVGRYAYAWDILPSKIPDEAATLFDQLDRATVYDNSFQSNETSFYESIRGNFETGEIYHPLEAAHAYFAERLETWLRSQDLAFPVTSPAIANPMRRR